MYSLLMRKSLTHMLERHLLVGLLLLNLSGNGGVVGHLRLIRKLGLLRLGLVRHCDQVLLREDLNGLVNLLVSMRLEKACN